MDTVQGGVRRRNLAWLGLSAMVIVLDQLTKYWVVQHIPLYQRVPVMPSLNLVHVHNTGVAFSMFTHAPALVFIGLSACVTVFIVTWLWRNPEGAPLLAAALSLILGGALGNAIDRVRLGYVVDFVDFYIRSWHFATFNLADSAISIGACALILDLLRGDAGRGSAL